MTQESQHWHFTIPPAWSDNSILEHKYQFLSQVCNHIALALHKSFHLCGPWFPFCKMGSSNQMHFSFKILQSCSHTFSGPPVARAHALTDTPHPPPSRLPPLWLDNSWLTRALSLAQLFGARVVSGSPFHLPTSCWPGRLNAGLPHHHKFCLTSSALTSLSFWRDTI